jgi:hypothetical protein
MLTQTVIALLLYPGLLLALGLSLLYTVVTVGRPAFHWGAIGAAGRSVEGSMYALSIILAGCGLALLPWPLHPLALDPGVWLWAWALFEGAFLLPLLPGLLVGTPTVVRAASREAQIGVAGRALLWLVLAIGLLFPFTGGLLTLPAYLLIIAAATFALPAAVGWGPFAAETTITPGGTAHGLDRQTAVLAATARSIRTAVLLAASLVALLPRTLVPPWVGLLLLAVVFILVSLLFRRLTGRLPRQTLPDALRLCWWRVLPPVLVAGVYLGIISYQ